MTIAMKPLHPLFAAELTGVDLAAGIDPATRDAIERAMDQHGLCVLPDQQLDDDKQTAFASLYGPLEVSPPVHSKDGGPAATFRIQNRNIADISNLDAEGRVLARDDRRNFFNLGNQLWHTDSSFKRIPAKCSLLSARELPSLGGETEFADLRAAWDALPETRQSKNSTASPSSTASSAHAARSGLPISTTRSTSNCRRYLRLWCGTTRPRAAPASISPRMPRTSSAGRSNRAER